ncbi:MAG TPA: hypothetical protein VNE39_29535 [Planctomycetota bacterium]|nr:hypothetical protein [Planctomycetota bacterium]
MRRRNHGVTITELLTVISVITILTSFVGPVVLTVKHAATARTCSNNLRQCYITLQLAANATYGKFLPCFELNTAANPLDDCSVKEGSWWYRKLFSKLYPTKNINAASPTPASPDPGRTYILPEYLVLRCPSSLDPYDQNRVHTKRVGYDWYVRVSGTDKDRVFDDNYGYNNFGFKYASTTDGSTFTTRDITAAIPDPATNATAMKWGVVGNSSYYRSSGGWGAIGGRPKHLCNTSTGKCACGADWPCKYTRLGEFAVVPEAARTMLMMDYVKADVAPDVKNDFLRGYRFRHAGRGNILFVDGHLDLCSKPDFTRDWGEPDHGTSFAKDLATGRARIHWAVLRP